MTLRVRSLRIAVSAAVVAWALPGHAQPPDEPAHIMLPKAPPKGLVKVAPPVLIADIRPVADPNRPTDPVAQINYDLQAFVLLFNQSLIFPNGTKCIFGGRPGYFGAERWVPQILRLRGLGKFTISNVQVDQLGTETAQVTLTENFADTPAYLPPDLKKYGGQQFQEHLSLHLASDEFHQTGTIWKIVPPGTTIPVEVAPAHLLEFLAFHLAQTKPQSNDSVAVTAQADLTLLDEAALRFSQIWNRTFAFNNATAMDALVVYARPFTFFVPGTAVRYSFNDHLAGISLTAIPSRDRTVTFYDGGDGILDYRYDGKAVVAFADGHVDVVAPDQAKNLIWDVNKPGG